MKEVQTPPRPEGHAQRAVSKCALLTMRLMKTRAKEVQTPPRPEGHAQRSVSKGVAAHPATQAGVSEPDRRRCRPGYPKMQPSATPCG